jgi:hypothetical protein
MIIVVMTHIFIPYRLMLPESIDNPTLLDHLIQPISWLGEVSNSIFFIIAGYFAGKHIIKLRRLLKLFAPLIFWSLCFIAVFLIFKFPAEGPDWSVASWIFFILTGNLGFVVGYIFVQVLFSRLTVKISQSSKLIKIILPIGIVIGEVVILNSELRGLIPELQHPWSLIVNDLFVYGLMYFWVFVMGIILSSTSVKIPTIVLFLGICILSTMNVFLVGASIFDISYRGFQSTTINPLIGVLVFLIFQNFRPFYSKSINFIGSLMFGVYILHVHYPDPFATIQVKTNNLLFSIAPDLVSGVILSWLLDAIIIFIACTCLEAIRKKMFEFIPKAYRSIKSQAQK